MSSSVAGSKRRAPYTTIACNNCRRRRCKCDGLHPACGACSFYCNWGQEDASQRPATKQLVESLRIRIRELELEVARLRAEPIGERGEDTNQKEQGIASFVGLSTALNDSKDQYPRRSRLKMREGNISASGPTSMWSTFPDEPIPLKGKTMPHPELIYRYTFQQIPSMPLESQSKDIQMSAQCKWDRYLPKIDADFEFTRLEHDTLLYNCFKYHTHWLHPLDPDLFLRDMLLELVSDPEIEITCETGKDFPYYSPFLHCALMALATIFSNDPRVRSKYVREQFANRAKQLLEGECERPTLTTIQGLVFLSEYHGSLGERVLAYLYFDKLMVRKVINYEQLLSLAQSLEYGRGYELRLPHLDVGLPEVDSIRDNREWGELHLVEHQEYKSQPNQSSLVFYEGCRLMLIAIRIMDTVYLQGHQQLGPGDNDDIPKIHNLPAQVRVSPQSVVSPLPHVIIINITYWWLRILLHRPFSFRTQSIFGDSGKSVPTGATYLSFHACEAAKSIVQLITIFDHTYGSQFFPLSMLQASASFVVSSSKPRTDAREMVQECIRVLRAASQTWETANSYASRLESLLAEQIWGESSDHQNANVYEATTSNYDDPVSQMFQEFIVPHDQTTEETGAPETTVQSEYPLLQQLNQQPQWGVPFGSDFMMTSSVPPLPFGLALDESQFSGETEELPLDTRS
ncbi:nitrogen assimilation transcription factor, partial [Rhizoctonia solani]